MNSIEHIPLLALAYTISIYLAVIAFCQWLTQVNGKAASALDKNGGRFGCIDGLRGLLALGVFVHHSFTAYIYFVTGHWKWSDSHLFNQLGQTGVALFFMITAFLFSSRLISGSPISWYSLFVSRIARLLPLYAVFVALTVISVFYFTGWQVREPVGRIAAEIAHWLAFVVVSRPDINAMPDSWTLIAGVNWSLRYEWLFYLALPSLYWLLKPFRQRTPARLVSAAALVGLALMGAVGKDVGGPKLYVLHFACGIIVALLYNDPDVKKVIATRWYFAVGTACLASLMLFKDANAYGPVLLSTMFFAAVVGATEPGGLLRVKGVLWLGEISYGVYLIHGLVLYWALVQLKAHVDLAGVGAASYGLFAIAIGLLTVLVASMAHLVIELPGIRLGKRMASLRTRPPMVGVAPLTRAQ